MKHGCKMQTSKKAKNTPYHLAIDLEQEEIVRLMQESDLSLPKLSKEYERKLEILLWVRKGISERKD